MRSYEHDDYLYFSNTRSAITWVDLVCSAFYFLRYCYRGVVSTSKLAHVVSGMSILDTLSIVSVLAVAAEQDLWLPFTFLRALGLSTTLQRIFSVIDLSEISEQLIVTTVDFVAICFTFSGIYFMLENLGNIPLQDAAQEKAFNFSFFDSVWFVFVTVATVGYGDIAPKSILGQISGVVMILVGVTFFGAKSSDISALYQKLIAGYGTFSKGGKARLRFSKSHTTHVILTGEVTEKALQDFAMEFFHPDHASHPDYGLNICTLGARMFDVDALVRLGILPPNKVQALCGGVPRDLHRVKIDTARAVFFLPSSNSSQSMIQQDNQVLLRGLSAKKAAPHANVYLGLFWLCTYVSFDTMAPHANVYLEKRSLLTLYLCLF